MFIDYESHEEFCDLMHEIIQSYKVMVLDLASSTKSIKYDHERHRLMLEFYFETTTLWEKLTKNQELEWCGNQCNALAFMLINTKILYKNNYTYLGELEDVEYELDSILYSIILSYFENDVERIIPCHFMASACVSIRDQIEDDSFVLLFDDDTDKPIWLDNSFIPLKKYQSYQLATAMGMHKRLGQNSLIFH